MPHYPLTAEEGQYRGVDRKRLLDYFLDVLNTFWRQRTLSSPPYAIINCVHGERNKGVTSIICIKKVDVSGAGILQTKDC